MGYFDLLDFRIIYDSMYSIFLFYSWDSVVPLQTVGSATFVLGEIN